MNDNFDPSKLENRALIGTVDWDSGGDQGVVKAVRLDPVTHALLTVEGYPHHEIHSGEHHFGAASALVGDGGTLEILWKSPLVTGHVLDARTRRKAHLTILLESALASTFWLYRNSTKTFNDSSLVKYWNRNDHAFAASESYYTSAMSICTAPGGTESSSDFLGPIYVGAAGGFGFSSVDVGGNAGGRNEIVCEPDRWYRLVIESRAANNAITTWYDWYDHAEQTDLTG